MAKQPGLHYTAFNEVPNGKRPVSTDLALLMEAALGVNPGMLLRMQTSYNLQVAKKDKTFAERLAEIRKAGAKHVSPLQSGLLQASPSQ